MSKSKGQRRSRAGHYRNKGSTISINPELIYAEREIWSPQYSLWSRYAVRMPRLPEPDEARRRWVEARENSPHSFQSYVGTHNQDYFATLNNYVDLLDQSKFLPETLVITGPAGSGKSSSVRIDRKSVV